MKFINSRLLVNDFAASLKFWRDVMQLVPKYEDASMGYAYFDTGNGGLEIMGRADFATFLGQVAPTSTPASYPAAFVFQVDDVDASYTQLVERGATSVSGPLDHQEVGVRSAQVADPDGYVVEVYNALAKPNA
ncbi:VOC family protein [Ktedonosporobacter rubrisoli]|uniref:VOC family protein n=1 Tax=Ktedonosporobacter rubrisoli TaxID=2509675 RepID=A0A4P6JY04_KTERU|nr:VOC family protein [Ktedonosporobacter rubrisoli]QBD80290.1 VOC family protein [Ktedonosporobacter rubrisoli]